MKKLIPILLMLIGVSLAQMTVAQDYSLSDVGRFSLRNSGTIVQDNVIKGYYIFYESEKVDRKNRAFEIVVLDENLKEIASERVIEPKTTYLLETSYNGNAILFKFYDSKAKQVYYRAMDNEGKLSSKENRSTHKSEIAIYNMSVSKDLTNLNTNAFGDKQFVDIVSYKDKKYTYKVQSIDNKGNTSWEYQPEPRKGVTTGGYLASSKDQLVILEAQSKSIMSRDYTFYLKVLNADGELDFDIDLANSKYNLMPHNAYFNEADGNIIIIGEHYDADDKSMKSESQGIFVKTISADGDDLDENFISWKKDIYSKVSAEDRKEVSKYFIYFHNIVQTSDGKILAIGEQYRKQVSAGGVAMKALAVGLGGSTDASSLEIKIGNMFIIELGSDHELSDVQILEKKPNKVILSQDYSLVNQHVLAKLLKAQGDFDYSFTQNNEDNSIVTIAYYDLEKVEGKLFKQYKLHLVNYVAADGDYTSDIVDLETESTYLGVSAAKPGHLLITEYFRKEKKIKMRMEPINF